MFIGSFAIALLLSGGSSGVGCISSALPPEGSRTEKPAFKGVELYTWKSSQGDFRYSLLWGTNRNKTPEEITRPECATGELGMLSLLGRLAVGEHVLWFKTGDECPACLFPSAEAIARIRQRAKEAGIFLDLDPGEPK